MGLLGLGAEAGHLDRGIALVGSLERRSLLLLLDGLTVGLGSRDTRLARHRRGMRGRQVLDVTRLVDDLLDLQRIDDDAELLHLRVAGLLDLLRDEVALTDQLLDRQGSDDRAQVADEDPADQLLEPLLLGQEAPRRIGDGDRVVAHLERGHGLDGEPDALARDAVLHDLRLTQGEGQRARTLLHRQHETAVPGDDAELQVVVGA